MRRFLALVAAAASLALVGAQSSYDCSLCPASGSVCCDCCIGGIVVPAVCNNAAYVGFYPALTPSATSTASITPTPTLTSSHSPLASPLAHLRNSSIAFALSGPFACATAGFRNWTVPSGVNRVSVFMWGAGGAAYNMLHGGAGAYVEGEMYVTPGETLRITVGGYGSSVDACGLGGYFNYGPLYGGGFSAVWRQVVGFDGVYTPLVVAAGGGGGNYYSNSNGNPGLSIQPGCGGVSAVMAGSTSPCTSVGGGGWPGGTCADNVYPYISFGGTSCAPGLINGTALSLSGTGWVAPNTGSQYYAAPVGNENGAGRVGSAKRLAQRNAHACCKRNVERITASVDLSYGVALSRGVTDDISHGHNVAVLQPFGVSVVSQRQH